MTRPGKEEQRAKPERDSSSPRKVKEEENGSAGTDQMNWTERTVDLLSGAFEEYQVTAQVQNHKFEAVCRIAEAGGGLCGCTTVLIKHIPKMCTQPHFIHQLETNGYLGLYDFLYMPVDTWTQHHKGCAIVNFVSPTAADSFFNSFNGRVLEGFGSEEVLSVMPSSRQGLKQNLAWAQLLQAATMHSLHVFPFQALQPADAMLQQHAVADSKSFAQQFAEGAQERPACTSCGAPCDHSEEEVRSYCSACVRMKRTEVLLDFFSAGDMPRRRAAPEVQLLEVTEDDTSRPPADVAAEKQSATQENCSDAAVIPELSNPWNNQHPAEDAANAAWNPEDLASKVCTGCEAILPQSHRFCMFCGQSLEGSNWQPASSATEKSAAGARQETPPAQSKSKHKKHPKKRSSKNVQNA